MPLARSHLPFAPTLLSTTVRSFLTWSAVLPSITAPLPSLLYTFRPVSGSSAAQAAVLLRVRGGARGCAGVRRARECPEAGAVGQSIQDVLAESFKTSVPWRKVLPFCERAKARVHRKHAERGLPGRPFITCRVTQLYPAGGSLLHHHGTGKLRTGFLDRIHSQARLAVLQRVEDAIDPANVFALDN